MSMNLVDVLLFQDRNQLLKLANDRNGSLNINSKRELIEVLYPTLMNFELISKRFSQLSYDAQKIALLLCYSDQLFLSKEELNGFVPDVTKTVFSGLLEELIVNGFLFHCADRNYVLPQQIKGQLLRLIVMKLEAQSIILPSSLCMPTEITVIHDLFSFIDYAIEKPLPLTKNGVIHKKDFQEIMRQFLQKEVLPNEQWRFGYGRRFFHYPDRFSLLYDFCYYNGWTIENEGLLCVTASAEELFEMKLNDLMTRIITYWLKLYSRPIPTIRLLFRILLDSLKDGEGIEEEALISLFSPFVKEYYFDASCDLIKKRFLNMLVSLNILTKIELDSFLGYTVGPARQLLK